MSRIDRRALLALGAAGFAGTASARPQSFGSVKAIPGGAWLTAGNQVVEILFTASGTVSVVKRATEARVDTAGFFLTHEQLAQDVTVKGDKVRHGDIEVRIDR
ncbi:MAG: hypothetical protein JF615_17580, partial [Asticcacaulis sp.]|nr:hypothetical protein [Asticcacaulis sp.]